MALLRACADAVVIGAGTMRATPGHLWMPAHVSPDLAASFAELRATLGRSPEPRLVVITTGSDLGLKHPALVKGATLLTTKAGADRIGDGLPASCEMVSVGTGKKLEMNRAVDEVGKRGFNVVLTEGGPHLMGELIQAGVLDETFVTLSPVLAGRYGERRLWMVEGVALLPSVPVWSWVLSARRQADFLFLRYALLRS